MNKHDVIAAAEPLLDCRVMRRDASFWNSPGWASRYHIPRDKERGPLGHKIAVCNSRIQLLDDDETMTIGEAGTLMCRKCLAAHNAEVTSRPHGQTING